MLEWFKTKVGKRGISLQSDLDEIKKRILFKLDQAGSFMETSTYQIT